MISFDCLFVYENDAEELIKAQYISEKEEKYKREF